MKLTKYIPVAIFSVLLMVSCNSNDEKCEKVITNKAISYGTGNTRLSDNKFEEGDVFSVWANYRVDDETERYISDQQVTLKDNVWTSEKNYYWPMGGVLDFYAVYPSPEISNKKSVNKISLDTDGTVPTLRYSIKDFSEDIDLLAAKSPSLACPYAQLVPLHFKHLLGRMRLKVTNKCEFGVPLDVHVTSMSISAKAGKDGILD